MAYTLSIPNTIKVLRTKARTPIELGKACGELLKAIPTLVSYHLDHAANHQNKPPRAIIDMQEYTTAVDGYLSYLRNADGCIEPFPDDLLVDRKARRPRRKYGTKYVQDLEKGVKDVLVSRLNDIFLGYCAADTQAFNKGLDRAMYSGSWCLYPSTNVLLEAREGDWEAWLKSRCEQLGMLSVKQGLSVFDDL